MLHTGSQRTPAADQESDHQYLKTQCDQTMVYFYASIGKLCWMDGFEDKKKERYHTESDQILKSID